MGKKIYISIATYNERENIEKLIRKIFDLKIDDLSVIVVDDNSPDGTSEAVKNLQSEFPSVFLIKRSGKLGYGTAHKAGFKKAMGYGADIIISMDADFSHDPKDIPSLIEQIEKGYDVAIGSRKVKDGGIVGWGLWRRFCSAGATFISKLLLGIKTQDLTNGFRAYKRSIFDEFDLDEVKSGGYSFLEESIYLIEKRGFSVKEIPVIFLNREFGKSKLTRHEIISFFRTIFKLKFNLWKRFVLDKKNIPLILLGASGFIGFWHALPMLDVIGDEMYFTGGVLRAIENHSLLPALGDVPYGTITYLFNYFLIGGFLLVLSIFFKFNFYDLKNYLVQSPELIYIIPRLLSAFLAMVYLWLFNKILKKEVENYKIRIFILILIFTNMLTVSVLHTGKMWVLSTLLVLISFYYLYEALKDGCNLDGDSNNRSIFLSILFSFLAAANFIFFAFSLINIPLFFIFFWRDKTIKIKIFKYVFISLIGFLVIISLNFPSTKQLVIGMLSTNNPILDKAVVRENLKIIASFWLYFKKIIAFFPLHLLAIILILKDKIKNKKLFIISTIYFFTYFIAISAVATWSNNIYAYSRYVLPLGFFLGFIVISFNIKFRKIFYFLSLPRARPKIKFFGKLYRKMQKQGIK